MLCETPAKKLTADQKRTNGGNASKQRKPGQHRQLTQGFGGDIRCQGLFSLPKSRKTANETLGIRESPPCTKSRHPPLARFPSTHAGSFCRSAKVPASASSPVTSVSPLALCGRWSCRNNPNRPRWITDVLPWVGIPFKTTAPERSHCD